MKLGKLKEGGSLNLDLNRLIETRLLIQANSGGGKSWNIRKLLEETHGKVQQIVLDIEGDFASLREKYEFILAGKGGDLAVSPKTAELLAHKVLELGVSIIIDLYELKQHERISFVARFLDAMTNAPKNLWHPVLVVIDEAHIFAPESGHAESMGAVVDLATRGRKRGFCAVLATQRLSKLNKDVAAECINKMIGRTGLDIDMKRAADELGFSKADMLKLRDLAPGEFYAFGPALSKKVDLVEIGPVHTQHPKAGKREYVPAPPTHKVKAVLSKLSDLPQEAEKDLKDKASMNLRIRQLEQELRSAKMAVKTETKVEKVLDPKAIKAEVDKFQKKLTLDLAQIQKEFEKKMRDRLSIKEDIAAVPVRQYPSNLPRIKSMDQFESRAQLAEGKTFGRCERAILKFLAMREGRSFTKTQVGALTQYSPGSGGFNNALSNLSQAKLITRHGDRIEINLNCVPEVKEILGSEYTAPETDALVGWLQKLGKCERTIFEKIKESHHPFTKEELGAETGYSAGSGGFNNAISRLNTLGLIQRNSDGTIGLNQELVSV